MKRLWSSTSVCANVTVCLPRRANRPARSAVFPLVMLLLASCGAMVQNPVPLTDPRAQTNSYPQKAYRIQVGDELDIRFFYNPELNDRVLVRPDGFISLQLIEELMVLDMTPGQLTSTLQQRYDAMIQRTAITVTVRAFAAQRSLRGRRSE